MAPTAADASGSGGHGTAGMTSTGAAGVFGLGGGTMGGASGEGGGAGSAGTLGNGGAGGPGGAGGNGGASPSDGDAAIDALVQDTSMTDDVAIDVGQDAGPDGALIDAGARDAEASTGADAKADVCVPSTEVCDGLDDNCNGNVDEQNVCPSGCIGIAHLGKGYMVCYAQARWATWPNAQADCVSRGMHLVRVDDAAENQWIVDTATGLGYNGGIWIGANDRQTDGVWVWTDGVQFWQGEADAGGPVGGLYNDWGRGQPNNNAAGGEDCGVLEFTGSWNWNDLSCDTFTRAYVCER